MACSSYTVCVLLFYRNNIVNFNTAKVFFTAKLGTSTFVQNHIVFDTIVTNEGQGYHSGRGWFNAPVNGTYFFIVTIANDDEKDSAQVTLTVNGNVQTTARAHQGIRDKPVCT